MLDKCKLPLLRKQPAHAPRLFNKAVLKMHASRYRYVNKPHSVLVRWASSSGVPIGS